MEIMKKDFVVDDAFVYEEERNLTVLKTSLFFPNDGFTVYDCKGDLLFRVDSYGATDRGELVLMDALGRCLLTVRRKRQSLHQRWEGYLAEEGTDHGNKLPIFSVRRSSIIGRCEMTVETYNNTGEEYQIEGCFAERYCTISDMTSSKKESVAEIRRKVDASTNTLLGKEVFSLFIKPRFDVAFAMGLVLVLDHINGGDEDYVDQINGNDCSITGVDRV